MQWIKPEKLQYLTLPKNPRPLYAIVDEKGKGWYADQFQAFRSNNKITDACSFKYFQYPTDSIYSTDIALMKDELYVASVVSMHHRVTCLGGDGFFTLVGGIWRFLTGVIRLKCKS